MVFSCHVTRESHQPVRHQRGYDKWWSTAATPDSTRMTQVSLYIALNNFVPLHCATWLLVPQTDQIHLPHNRWGRQIAQSGLGHGGKYRNIRLIHGSCQAGPGRDRSLFLDSLLADQSMEQSHKPPGGTGHSCPLPHTPAISSVAYTRGAAGPWSSASRLVFAYTPRRRWGPTGSQRRRPTDVHTATTTHLNFVQV